MQGLEKINSMLIDRHWYFHILYFVIVRQYHNDYFHL